MLNLVQRDHKKHAFGEFLATSALDLFKTAQYPGYQLHMQHRASDGQFDPVYKNFYSDFKSIESPATQHPENHEGARRVETAFVADFGALEPSPTGRILPMFIHVPDSVCEYIGKSKHCPKQTKAAMYVVKKLISHDVKPTDIMVIGAYRAEIMELRKFLPKDVLIATADAVQGQERLYVVFVFGTNKEVGPGFTMDRHRLCVSMSRQKNFLALVGDLDTVDYNNIGPSDKQHEHVHIANSHRYFVTKRRVGNYEKIQEAAQEAAEVPGPSNSGTPWSDADEQQMAMLLAEIDAAHAALKGARRKEEVCHPVVHRARSRPERQQRQGADDVEPAVGCSHAHSSEDREGHSRGHF